MTSPERPLFIVGCGRSGTTLLQVLIDHYSQIAIPVESHLFKNFTELFPRYGNLCVPRNLRTLVRDLLHDVRIKNWRLGIDVETFCRTLPTPDVRHVIAHLFSLYASKAGKRRWGDKSPGHAYYLREITRYFPEAQIIHVVRDGRDVVVSSRRAFMGKPSILANARNWSRRVSTCDAFERQAPLGTFFTLRYEDLVAHPQDVMGNVLAFLGEPKRKIEQTVPKTMLAQAYRTSRVQQALAQPISGRNVGSYRHALSPREVALFEGVTSEVLVRHGYSLDFGDYAQPSLFERAGFAYQDHVVIRIRFLWNLLHPKKARWAFPYTFRCRVQHWVRRMRLRIKAPFIISRNCTGLTRSFPRLG